MLHLETGRVVDEAVAHAFFSVRLIPSGHFHTALVAFAAERQ
jgi:hypothetical protein